MFPLLSLVCLALALFTLIAKRTTNSSKKKHPPGPPGLPIIGNLLQFDTSEPHLYLWRLSRTYGPLAYLKLGPTPTLVVSSARMAQQVLKAHDQSFCTRPPVLGQQRLSYGGLDVAFSPHNPHWKEMRKICLLHLFSPRQVLAFRPIREDEVSRMIRKIIMISSSSSSSSELHNGAAEVNLSAMAMSLASNLICRVAFGRRYDEEEFEKKRMDRLIMEAQALMVSFYFSDHFPALGWVDRASGLLERLDNNCRELDGFYQQLIDEHLHRPYGTQQDDDVIDLMIRLKDQHDHSDLTWDHIKALLMDLFVAGTDTVAATIVWTMTALVLRPAIMRKAQMQIREAVGVKGAVVDEDDIKRLPYLKAVVLEALRLYPPAPLLYRAQAPTQECSIGGYTIGPGTSVIINAWGIARDPESWDDPDEFRPERFFDVDVKRDDEFGMMPFGGGRRGCPGMGAGLASVELALANLLYSFDWAAPPGSIDTDALPGLTMHKKTPLVLLPTRFDFHVQT